MSKGKLQLELMKKIAIILPSNLPVPTVKGGAIETLVEDFILENEVQQKFEVFIFSEHDKNAEILSKQYKHSKFIYIKINALYKLFDLPIRIYRRLFNSRIDELKYFIIRYQLRKTAFDYVIIQGLINQISSIEKVIPHEKIILHLHADIIKRENKRYLDELEFFKGRIVTVSNYIKSRLVDNLSINDNQITVIKNCVSKQFINFNDISFVESEKSRLGISKDDFVILFVGRLVEDKGIQHLIKAINNIKEDLRIKLIVVGSFGSGFGNGERIDDFSEKTLELAKASNGKVIFTGFVNSSKKRTYYNISDLVVVPSLCNEAAGLVIIEALTCKKPVIASRRGGIPEYLTGDVGLLLDTDDLFIESLSEALITLSDKQLRDKMGSETKKYFNEYQAERFYNDYFKLLNSTNSYGYR